MDQAHMLKQVVNALTALYVLCLQPYSDKFTELLQNLNE